MATSDVSAKSFVNELMAISLDIVWKNPYNAIAQEDAEERMAAETYIASRNGDLNFYSVFQFHEEVLKPYFPDVHEMNAVTLNKRLIPENIRADIVAAESKYMIDYWENKDGEKNEYYRLLFGLPPLSMDPSRFLYNTKYHDIDETTPLHRLPYVDRLKLENRGYFDELLADSTIAAEHPYLAYLGVKRVYPYIARQAEYYQLIYCPPSQYQYLRQDFMDVYEEARRMVLRVYYNDAYRNKSKLYEGFLGLLILFMTQQRMCEKYLEADITRNFYDLESLRLVYDAYGVPFYPSIPLKYHERIVKHINELISYKGSTQVFYDVFGLFDFGKMDVFEYYLVKDRKVDEYGNPVFRDGSGKHLTNEQMWDLRFAKVGWKENKFVQVTDPENKIPYDYLTEPDPYWINDKQLLDKLYGEDWNYFQSKYMGVQIMFELSQLLFETSYFVHMLHDNREEMSALTVYYMLTGEDVPLFDMIIYALALLCRNAGYTGEIPSDPSSVAAVYGFNFLELNKLLKMATMTMDEWVIDLKKKLHEYAADNPVLQIDGMLSFLIDAITDGAFNWLGADFPYGEWLHAPPSVFLHDFTPTSNTVDSLREYLKANIKVLQENDEITTFEIMKLYKRFVSSDNWVYNVVSRDNTGRDISYETFIVKSYNWNEEDAENLRKAMIASYEEMLSYVIRLIDARTALTFDPHILDMISNMNFNNLNDVERVYNLMGDLDEYITVKMRESHSKVDYEAFANLRKILMTTKQVRESVTKRNGEVASTYEDLLADVNPELYQRYMSEDFDPLTEEDYVIQTLMRLVDDLTTLDMINTTNIQRVVNHMFKILRFLKSAKVDLVDFRIMYLISGRTMNYIKLLSEIWGQEVIDHSTCTDKIWLEGVIHATTVIQYILDRLWLVDKVKIQITYNIEDWFVWLTDWVKCLIEMRVDDEFQYLTDWLHTQKLTQVWNELCLITDRPEHQYLDIQAFVKSYQALWDYTYAMVVDNHSLDLSNYFFFRPTINHTDIVHTATPYILYLWDLYKSFEVIHGIHTNLFPYDYGFDHIEKTIMHEILMLLAGIGVNHVEQYIDSKFTFLLDIKEIVEVLYQARDGFVLLEGPDAILPVEVPKTYLTLTTETGDWHNRVRDIISNLPMWTRLWETHMDWRGQDSWLALWDRIPYAITDFPGMSYIPFRNELYDHVDDYRMSPFQLYTKKMSSHTDHYPMSLLALFNLHLGSTVVDWPKNFLTLVGNPYALIHDVTQFGESWLPLADDVNAQFDVGNTIVKFPLMSWLHSQELAVRDLQSFLALWDLIPYAITSFPGMDFLPFYNGLITEVADYLTNCLPFGTQHLGQHVDDFRFALLQLVNHHMATDVIQGNPKSYLALLPNAYGLIQENKQPWESWFPLMSMAHAQEITADHRRSSRLPLMSYLHEQENVIDTNSWLTLLTWKHGEETIWTPNTALPLWELIPSEVVQTTKSPLFMYPSIKVTGDYDITHIDLLPFYDKKRSNVRDYLTNTWVMKDGIYVTLQSYLKDALFLVDHDFIQDLEQNLGTAIYWNNTLSGFVPATTEIDFITLVDKMKHIDVKYLQYFFSKFGLGDGLMVDIVDAYLETLLLDDSYLRTETVESPLNSAFIGKDWMMAGDYSPIVLSVINWFTKAWPEGNSLIRINDLLKLIDKIRVDMHYLEWLIGRFRLKDVFIQDIVDAYLDKLITSDSYLKTSISEAPFHDAIMASDSLIKVSETLSA